MGFFRQLGLMLWKNWLLQRRRICVSIFEVILPLVFALLLLFFRSQIELKSVDEPTFYNEEEIDMDFYYYEPIILGYSPEGTEVDVIMSYMKEYFVAPGSYLNVTFKGFADEKSMEAFSRDHPDDMPHSIAFLNIDNTSDSLPRDIEFAIRPFAGFTSWLTDQTYSHTPGNKLRRNSYDMYSQVHFLHIQKIVSESLIKYWLSKTGGDPDTVKVGLFSQLFAYPPYIIDPMIMIIQENLPIFLVLSFMLSVIINTKNLVYEKEMKLKESMKLMGLKASVHWISWFVTFCIYLIPVLAIYAIIMGVEIVSDHGPILQKSDITLFFTFLVLYGFSSITFCFMVSSFVQKANLGAGISGVLFFGIYCPYFYLSINYYDIDKTTKLGFSLMFNCAMGLGAKVIGIYEGTGEGVQWDNFSKPATVDGDLTLLDCMLMLIVDSFLHLLVFWYLDNVRPGEFGVPKPYYFCFTKSYWCGTRKNSKHFSNPASTGDAKVRFEKEPTNLNPGIEIKELRKVFGKKTAVDGVSLNMYEGQISVLLGHNGAGKTTTMSMLTGFIPPTSGSATVNGYDITENIDGVRSNLGLCPQHNILFDTLTVKEHLQFFAMLKGASSKKANLEVEPLLKEVGLHDKINQRSVTLSGGQKRKLSVAIALIAGSKIVILDEPSSGMDPAARRQTWTLLQKHREGRTMILTTHYMDEADILGDRIAIMAEGVVKCCGSSMFLKKLYGAGYHLVMVKNQSCEVDSVTNVITSHIENAKLESLINAEVAYLLPDKETAKFPALFSELDNRKEELGISSFGTSATTMEEVFLKVGDSALHHDVDNQPEDLENSQLDSHSVCVNEKTPLTENAPPVDSLDGAVVQFSSNNIEMTDANADIMNFNKGFTKKTGLHLELSRIRAILVKKAIHTWRNRTITLVQLLLPVIFTIFGLTIDRVQPEAHAAPPLTFDLAKFDGVVIPMTTGIHQTDEDRQLKSIYGRQFGSDQTVESFNLSKYGKYDNYILEKIRSMGIGAFNKHVIMGLEIGQPKGDERVHAVSHYNGQPLHAKPIGMNYVMNALLQFFLNSTSYSLQSSIHPMPNFRAEDFGKSITLVRMVAGGFVITLFISFGMAFLTTLFIHYPIKERKVGAKHLQVVSGVGPISYWLSTFLWDFINFFVPCMVLVVVFACYQESAFVGGTQFLLVIFLLVMYGWAMLPFMYLLQFLFREPPTGVVTIIVINIISGIACLLTTFILNFPSLNLKSTADACDLIFMILFPNYSLAQSFFNIFTNYHMMKACEDVPCQYGSIHYCCKAECTVLCFKYNYLSYDKPGIGSNILFFFLQGVAFFVVVILIDYNIFQKIGYFIQKAYKGREAPANESYASSFEDSDVAAERQRINSIPAAELPTTDSLLLVNLHKRYGFLNAVDHTCVGIPGQECFGLLGQNGAGKTTTFKMLTGDVMVTSGNAYMGGYDICNNIKKIQANMGYCPQFDALIDQMTGRETLTMYARLRGVPEENIKQVVNDLIDILMLRPHCDKMSGDYSGGNKRKLSTAIALIGDPHFIMLDEPSAGLDPKARRQLWNVLSRVRASGRTLILTSHSMEECDALCTRVAIMVNGKFVCLGSPQHLKNKFGQGYTLIVQLGCLEDGSTAPSEPIVNFIIENFPGTKVFDNHQGYVHFQVPDSSAKLADVFSIMESTKVNLNVRDYSVHQTTLEQVFLMFTRLQIITSQNTQTPGLLTKICSCHACCK